MSHGPDCSLVEMTAKNAGRACFFFFNTLRLKSEEAWEVFCEVGLDL